MTRRKPTAVEPMPAHTPEEAELIQEGLSLIEEGLDNGQTRHWANEMRQALNTSVDAQDLRCLIEGTLSVESRLDYIDGSWLLS